MDKKMEDIMNRLKKEYGTPEPSKRKDPVRSLIKTILSQNTNDRNRDIAAERLFSRFNTPEDILKADLIDVAEEVKPAGLGDTKAERIKNFLKVLKEERGEISLEHVREMSVEDAKNYLKNFKGIGPKTAAVTLLFVFDMPLMPVDTHVHRLSKRTGIIKNNCSRKKSHDILEKKVPDERMYEFHINLINHGRTVCKSRKPLCYKCVLKDLCNYYNSDIDE